MHENSILTILKLTEVLKAVGLASLSGYNLSITPEKFPDTCKVAKLNFFIRKVV